MPRMYGSGALDKIGKADKSHFCFCIVKMNVLLLMGHPTREKFIKNSSTTSSAIRKLHTIAPPPPRLAMLKFL